MKESSHPLRVDRPASEVRPGDRFASGRRVTSVTHYRDGSATFTSITYMVPHYGPRTDVYLSTRLLPMAV